MRPVEKTARLASLLDAKYAMTRSSASAEMLSTDVKFSASAIGEERLQHVLGHAAFAMPLRVRQVVLVFGVSVIAEENGQRSGGEQHLFDGVENVTRREHRADAVERCRHIDEVKFFEDRPPVPARTEVRRKRPRQRVRLPQDVIGDSDVGQ